MVVLLSVSDVLALALARVASETLTEALALAAAPAGSECGSALDEVRLRLALLEAVGAKLADIAQAIDEGERQ